MSIPDSGALMTDELPQVLTRLEQYRLIEQVKDRWQMQVELTRLAFVRL